MKSKYFKSASLGVILSALLAVPSFAQEAPVNDIWSPDYIRNFDLASAAEQVDRYMVEVAESISAQQNSINEYDYDRIAAYNVKLRQVIETIYLAQDADLVNTFPYMYKITYHAEDMEFGNVENEGIRWLERAYANMLGIFTKSESANDSNGIEEPDYNRFIILMNKIDTYLANWNPDIEVDLPKHSLFERTNRETQGSN